MTETTALRQQLTAAPDRVLARLPAMGKVMIVTRAGGVTHERIGPVERIRRTESTLIFCGEAHDCTVDMTQAATAVADRSGRMKDKVLPKLEIMNASGELMFSVVGLDGLETFEEGLARFSGTRMPLKPKEAAGTQPTLRDDDPAMLPLAAAHEAATDIAIAMQSAGIVQRWRGIVPAINPAMGFVNIIAPDFHLHVRGGTVGRWERQAAEVNGHIRLAALDAGGRPTGLTLQGPRGAFGSA